MFFFFFCFLVLVYFAISLSGSLAKGGIIEAASFFMHSKKKGRPGQFATKQAGSGDNDGRSRPKRHFWVGEETKRCHVKAKSEREGGKAC